MQKLNFRLSVIVSVASFSLAGCSFEMQAGTKPKHPPPPPAQPVAHPATPTPASPTPVVGTGKGRMGKRSTGPVGPTPTPSNTTPTPPPPAPPPSGAPVVNAATPFGSGSIDPNGFKGSIYWVPAGTTKMPAFTSMQPNGFLFASNINVAAQPFTGGFPGVDPAHTTNFAIRYEAPLVVATEADYDFRLVADDGAILSIDSTPIIDNDGVKAAPNSKEGPVHLVVGTHLITVDYLQTTGNVALQLFCKKVNDTEQICPTHL